MRITEVKYIETPVNDDHEERRGPVITQTRRVCTDLPAHAIAGTVGCRPMIFLPLHTGAGPCGTLARRSCGRALAWSIAHLVEPLAAYYATYVPPMRFGAKPGPRGRRAA